MNKSKLEKCHTHANYLEEILDKINFFLSKLSSYYAKLPISQKIIANKATADLFSDIQILTKYVKHISNLREKVDMVSEEEFLKNKVSYMVDKDILTNINKIYLKWRKLNTNDIQTINTI